MKKGKTKRLIYGMGDNGTNFIDTGEEVTIIGPHEMFYGYIWIRDCKGTTVCVAKTDIDIEETTN